MPDKTILVEAISVEAVLPGGALRLPGGKPPDPTARNPPMAARPRDSVTSPWAAPSGEVSRGRPLPHEGAGSRGPSVLMYVDGRWADVPLARRRDLRPGEGVSGPALIAENFATTVVEPGWS